MVPVGGRRPEVGRGPGCPFPCLHCDWSESVTTVDEKPTPLAAREVTPTYVLVGLTIREMQVLYCISHGSTNATIGGRLHLSEDTVKSHARALFKKLRAADRAHAVRRGFELRLLLPRSDPDAMVVPSGPPPGDFETGLAEARRLADPGRQLTAALQSLGWTPPGGAR